MFRIVQSSNALPFSFIVDPTAQFEPGQIAQLTVAGNQSVCGVSDGSCPIGIIDDMRKNAFSAVSVDEVIIVPAPSVLGPGGVPVAAMDVKKELLNPNIVASSFVSRPLDVELIARNGVVVFLAGTPLNFSMTNNGVPDALRTVVSYSYQVPNVPGDDTTMASGRITVWFNRMIVQTDQYETNQRYPINYPLFVNERGLVTTRRINKDYPSIGFVTNPPSSVFGALEMLAF